MADQRAIADAKRRRNGKGNRIRMIISEITQLMSQNCCHVKVEYFSSVLTETLHLAYEQHEILMFFLDDKDPEYNDIFIADLTVNVNLCLAAVGEYLLGSEIEIPSLSSLGNPSLVEVKLVEKCTEPSASLETDALKENELYSSVDLDHSPSQLHVSIDHCDSKASSYHLVPANDEDTSYEISHNSIGKNNIQRENNQTTRVSEMNSNDKPARSTSVTARKTHFVYFSPPSHSWFNKLDRDTAVAHQLEGCSMFRALQSENLILESNC